MKPIDLQVAHPGPEMRRAIAHAKTELATPTSVGFSRGLGSKGSPVGPQTAGTFSKTCHCCGRTFDEGSWQLLDVIGYAGDKNYTGTRRFELRDCPCENTLWRRIR